MNTPENFEYKDILYRSRPDSAESRRRHPRMTRAARAKLFSPFAALKGFDETVNAKSRIYETRRSPASDLAEQNDRILRLIENALSEGRHPSASVCFFVPVEDERHGEYRTVSGTVTSLNRQSGSLRVGTVNIPLQDIQKILPRLQSSRSEER